MASTRDEFSKDYRKKVVVVGLDGASPRLLNSMLNRGLLPNLARVVECGSYGTMLSSIPDVTPPSWTSMVTGTNPGKHGVFDFFRFRDGRPEGIVTSAERKSPTVWETLSRLGKRVIVVNVPVTYPPAKVNGILVSDMLTPEGSANIVYPSYVAQALKNKGYEVGIRWTGGEGVSKKVPAAELASYVRKRFEVFNWMLSEFPWDFSMVVFNETDFAQHLFPTKNKSLEEVYAQVDAGFGSLLEQINGSSATLLVTSDHGFNVARRAFRVNDWLIQLGALRMSGGEGPASSRRSRGSSGLLRRLVGLLLKAQFTARLVEGLRQRLPASWQGSIFVSPMKRLDSLSGLYSPIPQPHAYVGLSIIGERPGAGSFHGELIELLTRASEKLVDPKTGVKPIRAVYGKGELFAGIYSINAPDAVLLLEPNYVISEKIFGEKELFFNTSQGIHEPEGILIAMGPSVRRGYKVEARPRVWDVAPTILRLLRAPASPEMDGRAIGELFLEGEEERTRVVESVGARVS